MLRGVALRDELFRLAEKRGLAVRREGLARGVTGGLARVHGVPTVFVDDRGSVDAQIEVLASVLRRFEWDDVFVHPALRKLVGASAIDGDDAITRDEPDATEPVAQQPEAAKPRVAKGAKPADPDAKPRPRRVRFAPRGK